MQLKMGKGPVLENVDDRWAESKTNEDNYTGENVAPLDEEHRGRLKAVLEEHLPLEVSIALTAHA